ncbi:NAD(P)/FAD-dependent oxidoreductase [Streptomyces sp. KM273126]|uniref:NAD(P)/FAD-dependent oxidoreductase n=1 Tax=Streptomyces sp. KM273126 TaxID=2545247 RepID=UPI00103D2203|nr:NAD(P)/FAD-dependent oxidoreductase [Streptomyces sp. KM273126]MBA2812937.1 NAD(P)/FAD-dependent oxidoreductase [Streptomyces sp. KM273126]
MTEMYGTETYEVIVIGGGAAGLSAALVLGRARRRTLVVDAGEPRNAPAAHMQGYLSRDGMPPTEFLAAGREEVTSYGVELVHDVALDVTRGENPDGFAVELASGRTVRARRLIVATGLADELPPVRGVAERFGRDVLHCPYCHGWEVRDLPFGVIVTSPMSVHQALLVTQWSKDVTLFPHTTDEADISDEDLRRLAAAGVHVVPGEVAEIVVEDDRLTGVRLADGTVHARSAVFVAPRFVPRTALLDRLGAETKETPFGMAPEVDETGRTTVPGVWAVGNATLMTQQVVHAAGDGYKAAATINNELVMEDIEAAVRV